MSITLSALRSRSTAPPSRPARWALVGLCLLAGRLSAAPSDGPASPPSLRDVQLAVQARRVLLQDEALAPLNLGVSVRQGVATVWGPVPSADLARRAVERLEKVQGLIEVRAAVYPGSADEPPAELPGPPAPPPPPEEPDVSAHLMRRTGDGATLVARPDRSPVESVSLLPPVVRSSWPEALPAPPAAPGPSLPLAVERLRQGDPRFRLMRAQLQGGTVSLYGTVARREHAMELAQSISRLPGVERVILQTIETDPALEPFR